MRFIRDTSPLRRVESKRHRYSSSIQFDDGNGAKFANGIHHDGRYETAAETNHVKVRCHQHGLDDLGPVRFYHDVVAGKS
jgi:hypothetical protein